MGEVLPMEAVVRKDDIYIAATQQIDKFLRHEPDMIANLANVCAILQTAFDFFWVGFYFRQGSDLVLGPFQGKPSTTRLQITPCPDGACGQAAVFNTAIILADVEEFSGYVCDHPETRSEIVVPLVVRGKTELLINIESDKPNAFDGVDQHGIEVVMRLIERRYFRPGLASLG